MRTAPSALCHSPLPPPPHLLPPPQTPFLPKILAPSHIQHLQPVDWGCSQHPQMRRVGVEGTARSLSLKPAAAFPSAWMTTASAPQTCNPEMFEETPACAVLTPVFKWMWLLLKGHCDHLPQCQAVSLVPPTGEVALIQMKDAPGCRKAKRHSVCCTQDCEQIRRSVFFFLFF